MKVTSGSTATAHVDRKANRDRQGEKNGTLEISVVTDTQKNYIRKFIFLFENSKYNLEIIWPRAVECMICINVAVNIPEQPDWLFQRPMLTMDFVPDTEPPDQVGIIVGLSIYYRPQRSWGKVIFSQASVILLTGEGGVCSLVETPPGRLLLRAVRILLECILVYFC